MLLYVRKSSETAACKFITDVCCICALLAKLELRSHFFVVLSSEYVLCTSTYIYSGVSFPETLVPSETFVLRCLYNFCQIFEIFQFLPHFAGCFCVWDWVEFWVFFIPWVYKFNWGDFFHPWFSGMHHSTHFGLFWGCGSYRICCNCFKPPMYRCILTIWVNRFLCAASLVQSDHLGQLFHM